MKTFEQRWQDNIEQRKAQHLHRVHQVVQSPQAVQIEIDNKRLINFSSNDYLSLANHPLLIEAVQQASKKYGVGAGASHLVCGHSQEHCLLEEELAAFTGRDKALVFSSGYMANLGVLSALLNKQSAVFEDKLNHASLLDGGLLSGARFQRFLHNDMRHLEARLQSSKAQQKMIVCDAVFSMDGDLAPLPELVALAEQYHACLMLDDAHGFGCLGETGAGSVELYNLNQQQVPVLMATLSKALGSFGAFVAGSDALIDNLIQFSRSYIYTTALPPAMAAAARAALRLLKMESWRRQQLQNNITYFKQLASEYNLPLQNANTAIQPIIIGDSARALAIAKRLKQQGILLIAIRPPTVAQGSARLRITLNAQHTHQQLEQLVDALVAALTDTQEMSLHAQGVIK